MNWGYFKLGLTYNKYGNVSDSNLTFTPLLYGNGPGYQKTIRNFSLTDAQTSK